MKGLAAWFWLTTLKVAAGLLVARLLAQRLQLRLLQLLRILSRYL